MSTADAAAAAAAACGIITAPRIYYWVKVCFSPVLELSRGGRKREFFWLTKFRGYYKTIMHTPTALYTRSKIAASRTEHTSSLLTYALIYRRTLFEMRTRFCSWDFFSASIYLKESVCEVFKCY